MPTLVEDQKMKKLALILAIAALLLMAVACGTQSSSSGGSSNTTGSGETAIKTAPLGNLTVTLANGSGQLKKGENEFLLTVKDSSGKAVEVNAVSVTLSMPAMGSMAEMNDQASFATTKTPGVCRGKIDIEVGGEWQAKVVYDGPAGRAETSFPVNVQQ